MGKRKSSSKPVGKTKAAPLATSFKCVFCHHDKSVSVKLDKLTMFGHLNCKVCGQKFAGPITNLSAPVDIYCDWVDACEELRARQPAKVKPRRAPSPLRHGAGGGASYDAGAAEPKNAGDDEDDADGEDDEDPGAGARSRGRKDNGADEEDEEDEVEEADYDAQKDKRRKVRDYDDEDEDED